MKYTLTYQSHELAEIIVDPSAFEAIVIMVEFWTDWEDRLESEEGNYFQTWLKQLAMFILRNRRAPDGKQDEGWCAFDGSHGITLLSSNAFEFEEWEIEIVEA